MIKPSPFFLFISMEPTQMKRGTESMMTQFFHSFIGVVKNRTGPLSYYYTLIITSTSNEQMKQFDQSALGPSNDLRLEFRNNLNYYLNG